MFREMRRKDKQMNESEAWERLNEASHGILSVNGENDYPFGVPVSYSVVDKEIMIHGSFKGHKMDSIKGNDKVSFTVVLKDEIVGEKFTTEFASIVVFGRARIVEEEEKKDRGLFSLIEKYSQGFLEEGRKYIDRAGKGTCLIAVEVEHITGKRSKNSGE